MSNVLIQKLIMINSEWVTHSPKWTCPKLVIWVSIMWGEMQCAGTLCKRSATTTMFFLLRASIKLGGNENLKGLEVVWSARSQKRHRRSCHGQVAEHARSIMRPPLRFHTANHKRCLRRRHFPLRTIWSTTIASRGMPWKMWNDRASTPQHTRTNFVDHLSNINDKWPG